MGMDINDFISSNVDNCDDVRDHTMTFNKNSSKTIFMSSSKASVDYATKMEQFNNISKKTVFIQNIIKDGLKSKL